MKKIFKISLVFSLVFITGCISSTPIKESIPQESSTNSKYIKTQRAEVEQEQKTYQDNYQKVQKPQMEKKIESTKSTIRRIDKIIEDRMRLGGSYRDGCPVSLNSLRYLKIRYFGFDKQTHYGEMIVHKDIAKEVVAIFDKLYSSRYPIRKMRLVSNYGGDDDKSMEADNTSAFNCRKMTNSTKWSKHSYGKAIDINPRENPYVRRGVISPINAKEFAYNRYKLHRRYKSVIIKNGIVVQTFKKFGWKWGGEWRSLKDYQHFEKSH